MPRKRRHGSKTKVLIPAPATVAMGMVRAGGHPRYAFNIPDMYPPVPIKRAPPKQTNPTYSAKKSKPSASSAKIPAEHKTLCQYMLKTRGSTNKPRIKTSLGMSR